MDNDDQSPKVSEVITHQMEIQKVACIGVKDGQLFIFPKDVLVKLLAKAEAHPQGRVAILVKKETLQ